MISTVPELSPDDFRRASMYRKKLASEVVALADEMATHIKTSILPFQTSGEGKVWGHLPASTD